MTVLDNILTRRRFLGASAGVAAAALIAAATPQTVLGRLADPPPEDAVTEPERHQAWVWQFNIDGDPWQIRETLAKRNMAILLKTHDGTNWQARWDGSPYAIAGPDDVAEIARFFEAGGVPFHAWCGVKGHSPAAEAEMASDVLSAGARSLALDLEPYDGFWVGDRIDAIRYGHYLRQRQPDAKIVTSIDPRPWVLKDVPMREFAAFSDAWAPQTYWGLFSSPDNVRYYREWDDDPGPAGVTPRFVIESSRRWLEPYGLPIEPIGDGTVRSEVEWSEFVRTADGVEPLVSVWRYGVTSQGVWRLLGNTPPKQPVSQTPVATSNSGRRRVSEAEIARYRNLGAGMEAKRITGGLTHWP